MQRFVTTSGLAAAGALPMRALRAMDAPETYIPLPHRRALIDFIEAGREVGSFLMCVLDNNLQGAIREANDISALHIVSTVKWLWNYAPREAWGTESNRRGYADARRRMPSKRVA